MAEKELDDELLGRWLSGDLSAEEKERFEASEGFETYRVISEYSSQLAEPDYNTDAEYQKLQGALKDKKPKETPVVKMSRWRFMAMAASVTLLIGLGSVLVFNRFFSTVVEYTAQGETRSIVLPDQSEIALNVSSSVEYNENSWEDDRSVTLAGEAYFKVNKGSRFLITTNHGTVEVLGTEFNIRNRNAITEVICYEGTVKVTDLKGESKILEQGDFARIKEGIMEVNWVPEISGDAEWKNGYSTFHNSPFINVVEELENQYKVSVNCETDISNRVYVGAFPHDNIEEAMQLVFAPMGLEYSMTDSIIEVH